MYALIPEAKENIQGYSLSGTVGSVPFSQKNVVGNFTVSNKATNPSTFNLGNASIGQLTCTLYGLNISRNAWKGLYITPTIQIGQTAVPFPAKRYRIDQAQHVNGLVKITAYDDMERFEKASSISVGTSGTPYEYLTLACRECGVTLGMTEGEVRALPNGTQPIVLEELGDIETWRDVLYWVGVTTASFSRINREGKLELRAFHDTVDDTLPANVRYDGAVYNDEIMTYTGVYVNITADKVVKYYPAAADTGYTLAIGTNPFLQGAEAYRAILATNIAEGMSGIGYIAGSIEIPFGFHYDLGDVLQFPGGSGANKFCLMGYEFTYNGRCKLTGIPDNKKSSSKTDKSLQNLLTTTNSNDFTDYEQKNLRTYTIGDQEEKRLIMARLASNNNTKAMIHIEVNLEAEANEITDEIQVEVEAEETQGVIEAEGTAAGSDIFHLVSQKETKGVVRYLINSEEQALKPVEQWTDGKHVLHLMYIIPLTRGNTAQFEVYMKADGGTITIPEGSVWFYASGRGLVGDGKWDGSIEIQEEAEDFTLLEITMEAAAETISAETITPETIQLTDAAAEWSLIEISIAGATDALNINFYTETYTRITEDEFTRITEDGATRYTEGD